MRGGHWLSAWESLRSQTLYQRATAGAGPRRGEEDWTWLTTREPSEIPWIAARVYILSICHLHWNMQYCRYCCLTPYVCEHNISSAQLSPLHVVRNLYISLHVVLNPQIYTLQFIPLHVVQKNLYIACCAKLLCSLTCCAKSIFSMACFAASIGSLACCWNLYIPLHVSVKSLYSIACCAQSIYFSCMLCKIYIFPYVLCKIYIFPGMLGTIYIFPCILWEIYIFPCMLYKIFTSLIIHFKEVL